MLGFMGYAIVLVIGILIGRNMGRMRDYERRLRDREPGRR